MPHTVFFYARHLHLLLVLVTAGLSCTEKGATKKEVLPPAAIVKYKKPPATFNDTLIIAGPAAIFFNPDSIQVQHIRKRIGDQLFESTRHDCSFQQLNARKVLKRYWPSVKEVNADNRRFLLFINDNQQELFDLNAINDMCGLVLFKAGKKPEVVDMTNIETALHNYFS